MAFKEQQSRYGKKVIKNIIKTVADLLFITFCSGLSMLFLFFGNIAEIRFREISLPLLAFSAFGWLLYLILRLMLKRQGKAAVLSGIVMAVITNAGMLTDMLGYIAVLVFSLVLTAAAFFIIIKFAKSAVFDKIEYIATAVAAGLILFNVVISIPQITENRRLSREAKAKTQALEEIELPQGYTKIETELPNVYIFVFDELAGTKCMKEVFGYDNTGLYNDMRYLGFNVSDDCTNYKQFTLEALAGIFNMDYVYDYDTDGLLACGEQLKDARMFSLMEDMGYSLYEAGVSDMAGFEKRMELGACKESQTTEDGYTTLEVILGRTLISPVIDKLGIMPSNHELYEEILGYYAQPENYTYENALTFTYVCCPHAPFIYDINGDPVDEENSMNWTDSKYFLEQYEYMCGRITQTMAGIIENDPDAVIMVLSDHGVKANKELWDGPSTTYEQSTDTFFAVYTGGRDDLGDITGLSGANVIRTVLNSEYGFELDMAPAADK